jgi:DNA-binding NarL/FixJ family response regulator
MIKLLIIGEEQLLADVTKQVLEDEGGIEIAGFVRTVSEACRLCETLRPDVILTDIRNPAPHEMISLKTLKSRHDRVKFLVLASIEELADIHQALKEDVADYLLKDLPVTRLAQAVKDVYHGSGVADGDKSYLIRQPLNSVPEKTKPRNSLYQCLKDQELTLIRFIAEGKSNRQIAEMLFLSEGRVKNMITELFGKLKVKNRYELTSYAYKNDLVE